MAETVIWRAQLAAWRAQARTRADLAAARIRARRHTLVNYALIIGGGLGMLAGAAIVARWLLGLTLMAECGWLAWLGLSRDDGEDLPVRGARTVRQVLADERLRASEEEAVEGELVP